MFSRLRVLLFFLACTILQFIPDNLIAQSELGLNYDQTAEFFIERVSNAQESSYSEVIAYYEKELRKKDSAALKIQQCTFIDKVFFNEDEYYNPKYEEFETCLEELKNRYSNSVEAVIYYHFHQYDESSIVKLEQVVDSLNEIGATLPYNIWMAYKDLANHYTDDNPGLAISYAKDAMNANSSEDLSILIAKQYLKIDEKTSAERILIDNVDSTAFDYNEYERAELLEELGNYESAYQIYLRLNDDWDNQSEIGRVLKILGRTDEAREYLREAAGNDWNKRKALEEVFLFDLEYSSPDSLVVSYNEMRDYGFWADPFGVYKAKMIFEKGVTSFKFRDVIPIFSFIVLILICVLIPYLWILPIYSFGKWRNDQGIIRVPFDQRWDLKHFWYLSSLFLAVSFFSEILFNYSEFIASFNDEFIEENINRFVLAKTVVFSDIILVAGTFLLFRKKDFSYFLGDTNSIGKNIGLGIAFFVLLRIVFVVSSLFTGTGSSAGLQGVSLIEESILGVTENYGSFVAFFIVVIIAPVLEEIQFRGIMLGSASKYIPFWVANVLQSLLFVMAHDNYSLFIFYFCFGMFTGYLRKKTGSYVAPIALHMLNNFLAFFAMTL